MLDDVGQDLVRESDRGRIAPVVLLTDPAFREVITAPQARLVVTTPRGEERGRQQPG
ncbi:hypothetical protein [Streptomyces clavifer]|uniref:hypothetical protein n=1 Tax=Streptomyces clavifer TaxID=68188 RepID=UPI00342A9014